MSSPSRESSKSRRPSRSGNQRDLALAYSPGVAAPCEAIAADPEAVTRYTSRGNLVAVSFPTAPRCWASGRSARWRASR